MILTTTMILPTPMILTTHPFFVPFCAKRDGEFCPYRANRVFLASQPRAAFADSLCLGDECALTGRGEWAADVSKLPGPFRTRR